MTVELVALLAVESAVLAAVLWLLWRRREPPARDGDEVEERYHMVIDRLPATVAPWDKRTRVVSFVSAQIEQLTGEPAAMWAGADGKCASERAAGGAA